MPRVAIIDFETCSPVDLKRAGVEKYAEHPETRALCIAWAFDGGEVRGELLFTEDDEGTDELDDLLDHVTEGGAVVAHNAPFELAIWNMLHRRWPLIWPALRPEQTHCTMAMALAMGLPGSLGEAAKALRLPVEKDAEGHKLMLKLCKPRKAKRGEDPTRVYWDHHTPEALARLLDYCKRDVEPEREIWNLLPKLSDRERAYWILDRKINDRGIAVDVDGVMHAANACDEAKEELNAELASITGGEIPTASSVAKIVSFFDRYSDIKLPDARKGTIEAALSRSEPESLSRRILEIRNEASKSSTAKLDAAIAGACADGRLRGLIAYHGAGTGRAAGRRWQPQNMMRPPKGFKVHDAIEVIDWLKHGAAGAEIVKAQYGSVISAVAYAMRSFLKAAPGKTFVCADYSNIEGRMLAWLAGEQWKLRAFREFDAGSGHDLYKLAYAKAFGIAPEDVDEFARQIGKVMELALGYQGAHGAFLTMAKGYNVDLDALAKQVQIASPAAVWKDALESYWRGARETAEELIAARLAEVELDPLETDPDFFDVMREAARSNRHGLEPNVWTALRIIVDGWRAAHPNTVMFWRSLESAAIEATERPGTITMGGSHIAYCKTGDFLMCRLPSGRKIAYPYARMEQTVSRFDPKRVDKKLVYEGVDSKTKRWCKQFFYGGAGANHVCQGTARDILVDAQFRLEREGFATVLHVHDENICEVEPRAGLADDMRRIMTAIEPWSDGLPVAVGEPWVGQFYRKG